MAHPNREDVKQAHNLKLRGIVGANAKAEHPWDKANRIAYEDRRVVGDPSPADQITKFQEGK